MTTALIASMAAMILWGRSSDARGERIWHVALPAAVAVEGGDTWAPHYPDLTRDALEEAHALGLRVIPWTVNDPAAIARLIEWGVDGLISDYPDRVTPPGSV